MACAVVASGRNEISDVSASDRATDERENAAHLRPISMFIELTLSSNA